MITNNNITFGAKINICNADNLLSAKELKKLTKAGEKIGKNTDSIDIYIGNSKNDMFISTYTTNFKSKENPTNIYAMWFQKKSEISPFDFLLSRLKKINTIYKKLT